MDIVALAGALVAGKITEEAIRENYGNDTLTKVLALGGGLVVGQVAYDVIDALNPLDDLLDIF